ncbi:MAG: M28 family peptidase [Candidatus Hodarchaeota archaeon]
MWQNGNHPKKPKMRKIRTNTIIISGLILGIIFLSLSPHLNINFNLVSSHNVTKINQNLSFNSSRAYELILKQANLGPRYPGSEGIEKVRHLIASELFPKNKWTITYQNFSRTWLDNEKITLVNIICKPNSYNQSHPSFLLLAHYDTRLWADKDPNSLKRKQPVPGANDGASGIAVALELGKVLLEEHNVTNFQLVFFDGEDQGNIGGWDWLVGSNFYAKSMEFKSLNLSFGILFDMVGGDNAVFKKEGYSNEYASQLVSLIWREADTLGYDEYFVNQLGKRIIDDHLPLLKEGFPAIDIVDDFSSRYIPWHTTFDNITYISKETLEAVGFTIESFLSQYADSTELASILRPFTFHTPFYFLDCFGGLVLLSLIILQWRRNSNRRQQDLFVLEISVVSLRPEALNR